VTNERALALAIAKQRGHPVVVLFESTLDLTALDLVPRVIAEQHKLLPLAVDGDSITIAVADLATPLGTRPAVFDQIEFATGRRLMIYLAVESFIAEAIALAYEARVEGRTHVGGEGRIPGSPPLAFARPPPPPLTAEDSFFAPGAPPPSVPIVIGTSLITQPQILIVDDEEAIRVLLRELLAHDGYDIIEARTGREALEKLRTLRPSAILLDAMLPEIHGFDICATLKKSPAFQETPIVVISAVYRGWEHARTVQENHGADAFVEKPFDINYLRQLVARLVGKELPKNQLGPGWLKKVQELREEAESAYQLGDDDACEDAVKRWRALDPFDAHGWVIVGNARTRRGDLEGAMKAWERAATFDGSLFVAFKNLAVIYEKLGFIQRSLMAWHRAAELSEDDETRARIEAHLASRGQADP
jgi:CheY-like chemotaxis protein